MSDINQIYYMRDNHTFKQLSSDIDTAIEEISVELDNGYTSGSLMSKRQNFKIVHTSGFSFTDLRKFLKECRVSLEQAAKETEYANL